MSARDRFHQSVKTALRKDGWTITHDPYRLVSGRRNLWVDLGAEQLLGAEKEARRIAIEVKTFGSPSDLADLEQATGQFVLYRALHRVVCYDPQKEEIVQWVHPTHGAT